MRISDWSSDVCSSDLAGGTRAIDAGAVLHPSPPSGGDRPICRRRRPSLGMLPGLRQPSDLQIKPPWTGCSNPERAAPTPFRRLARQSVVYGQRVSVRVDLGGRRILKKKTTLTLTQK